MRRNLFSLIAICIAALLVPITAQAQATDAVLARLNKAAHPSGLPTDDDWVAELTVAHRLFDRPDKPLSREQAIAIASWDLCPEKAVDRFAKQAESARTVAEAALEACGTEETAYMIARGLESMQGMREAVLPQLIARVIEIRSRAD
jgi:hypothetical protein